MFRTGSPARFVLVLAALVGLTVTSTNTAPLTPLDNAGSGVVCDTSTGHCYEYVAGPLNWNAAKAAAESMQHNGVSGHLATMTSQAEIDFIVANLPDAVAFRGTFDGGAYIGAFQPPGSAEPGGGWQWVTGEPWSYTNWQPGEPNNSGGEDVAHFWTTAGKWNDVASHLAKGFLVEYPAPAPLGSDLVIGKGGEHGHRGNMAMLFGNGAGGFAMDLVQFNVWGQTHEVAVGDLNDNGQDDVVVVSSGGQVYVALGGFSDGLQGSDLTPSGAFVEGSGNCCNRVQAVKLEDVNNDGNLDIVVMMWTAVGVMLGNGDGTFGSPIYTNAGGDSRGMALGDLNGDGKVDLVAAHAAGIWQLILYRGNGDGTFQPGTSIPGSLNALPNVFIKDANGDGHLDIYTGALNGRVKLFRNDGSANFTITDFDAGAGMQGRLLVVDDLNGDGTPDVLAATETNGFLRLWLSDGSGGFVASDTGPVGSSPFHGAVGDFNKDGIKDIAMVTAGTGNGGVWILLGTGPGTFAAPYSVPGYRNNYTIAAGNFKSAPVAPVACIAGTYSTTGNEPCTLAQPGYFVATAGAVSQSACPVGFFSSVTGATACEPAPAGSYVDTVGAAGSLLCPAGTYSSTIGSPSCTPADAGFFVPLIGSTSQTACAVGYGSDGGAVECYPLDSDGDGVYDNDDAYPNSNMSPTVSSGTCVSGVTNQVLSNGATFNDLITTARASARNHGQFVSAVTQLATGWRNAGLISGRDHGAITSCVARSK